MSRSATQQTTAFTLIELLLTAGITALIMLAVTSLFITFLLTASKNRLSQSVRESGTNAMQKMTEMLRGANSVNSNCASATDEGVILTEISLVGQDGLTTILSELDDKIASTSAENGIYYLTNNEDGEEGDNPGYLQNLLFTCYATELGAKYVEIAFTISTSPLTLANSPTVSHLDFKSGVSLRN